MIFLLWLGENLQKMIGIPIGEKKKIFILFPEKMYKNSKKIV